MPPQHRRASNERSTTTRRSSSSNHHHGEHRTSSFSRALGLPSSILSDIMNDAPPQSHRPPPERSYSLGDDRAKTVSQSVRLQASLARKLKHSGVVTTAGYNAILQDFLMSDEVTTEVREQKEREDRQQRQRNRLSG
eukprot:CAMPEP_0183722484 /NCGR_PEP_ID=MMETSP0737-20130205/14426_1 /TAXON_ID=385413 /ORGANISM="Thalassiosira miniscula, Strain CCMP1093" /LENGTH=136 /DNA_ID=CAMNT_0025952653 /DNA_START=66 /DNA_END=472 /DNA_ORIENTATION=-